jgi:hypothetical protein
MTAVGTARLGGSSNNHRAAVPLTVEKPARRGSRLAGGGFGGGWLHPSGRQSTRQPSGDGAGHGGSDTLYRASIDAADPGTSHPAGGLEGHPPGGVVADQVLSTLHRS